MKKILLLLAILLSMSIAKADEFEYNGLIYETVYHSNVYSYRDGTKLIVKGSKDDIEGTLTIPAYVSYNGQELPVYEIGESAFKNQQMLTGVNFPCTLYRIGREAFSKTGIKTVDLSNTHVLYIRDYAFAYCENLNEVKLPSGNPEQTVSISCAFVGCNAIKSLIIPPYTMLNGQAFQSLLPPMLEDLYAVSWQRNYDLSNVTLHVPKNRIQAAIETWGDKCKGYQIWDFEAANRVEPDLTGFELQEYTGMTGTITVPYITVGKPTRLSFKIFPENSLFKSIYIYKSNPNIDLSLEYDGEDAVIFTLNRAYNDVLPVTLFSVRPQYYEDKSWPDLTYTVCVFQNPDPNYPTSIGFEYPEVRIKPFEFFYQPVAFYPEGSTTFPLSWESSDPAIATVTKEGKVYPLVEEGTVTITATADDGKLSASYTAIIDKNASAIDDIFADEDTNTVYYNLQGVKVAEENLTPGIYITKRNGKIQKVVIH